MKSIAKNLRDSNYYGLAHKGSTDLTHPSIKVLLKLFGKSGKILDMGCGEGTRLATLSKNQKDSSKKLIGIDTSEIAINLARERYPKIEFLKGDLEHLPFKEESFDLLLSAYVFEHLKNPEKVLDEARRVLKKDGLIMIIAPNFGSPNRRSPNSIQIKIKKLLSGFIKDLKLLRISNLKSLGWQKVIPSRNKYTIDADTTVEPYLLTLIKYSKNLNFKVEYFSSNWSVDRFSFFQLMFKIFGSLNIYPFKYWGPHLAVVLKKSK